MRIGPACLVDRQNRTRTTALASALGGAALEALDATARIDELLLARVERVAVGADLHVQVALGRACGELVPAGAGHSRLDVGGMDVGLHGPSSVDGQIGRASC